MVFTTVPLMASIPSATTPAFVFKVPVVRAKLGFPKAVWPASAIRDKFDLLQWICPRWCSRYCYVPGPMGVVATFGISPMMASTAIVVMA